MSPWLRVHPTSWDGKEAHHRRVAEDRARQRQVDRKYCGGGWEHRAVRPSRSDSPPFLTPCRSHCTRLQGRTSGTSMSAPMEPRNTESLEPKDDPSLWEAIHRELRSMAGHLLRGERAGHTLQPTALVNEAYLKLHRVGSAGADDRSAFLRMAATAMRRVLVDHARHRLRQRRKSGRTEFDLGEIPDDGPALDLEQVLDLAEALEGLEQVSARHAQVVDLRHFGGLSEEETAAVLGIHRRTVQESMRSARAWLREALAGGESELTS